MSGSDFEGKKCNEWKEKVMSVYLTSVKEKMQVGLVSKSVVHVWYGGEDDCFKAALLELIKGKSMDDFSFPLPTTIAPHSEA
jgi:hypothetical protein